MKGEKMPKAKILKDMVVDAAFEIARESGIDNVNARTVSEKLGCSTQPVMYHFKTIEELKAAVYEKADEFHTGYLMSVRTPEDGVMMNIGLNYIRFAIEEPNLFRLLFQSGYAPENNLLEMIDSPMLEPVISAMREEMGLDTEKTKEVFLILAMFAHGYASIIANNSLEFDEKLIASHLEKAYNGAVASLKK